VTRTQARQILKTKWAPSSGKVEATRKKVGSICGAPAQKATGVSIRAAAGRPQKNYKSLKSSARQGEIISERIRHAPHPTSAMDGNSRGCKGSEGMGDKDKYGAAGMQQLNMLPIKCKAFLFDMGIFTASVFLSNEVGELATKYQAWHKLTADKNQSDVRPASCCGKRK
jgi:hypothetical protein